MQNEVVDFAPHPNFSKSHVVNVLNNPHSKKRSQLDSIEKTKATNLRHYNDDTTTNNNKNPSFPPQWVWTPNRWSFYPISKPTLLGRRRDVFRKMGILENPHCWDEEEEGIYRKIGFLENSHHLNEEERFLEK